MEQMLPSSLTMRLPFLACMIVASLKPVMEKPLLSLSAIAGLVSSIDFGKRFSDCFDEVTAHAFEFGELKHVRGNMQEHASLQDDVFAPRPSV